jgi:hypothetical protein
MSEDARCAERFLCALFRVVKPISDFRLLISGLCAILFALCLPAEAQQAKKIPRIGYLSLAARPLEWDEAFKQGMSDLGWVEGQNIRDRVPMGGKQGGSPL